MSDERRALRQKHRALFDAAMAAWRLDRFATALVYAGAAAKACDTTIDPGPTHALLVKLLTHLRRYEETEKLLAPLLDDDNAPADDSQSPRQAEFAHKHLLQALDAMGRLEERRGCFDAAARCYQRYIDAEPESHRGHLMLGHVLYRQGRLSEAESALAEAVKCQDANEVVHRQIGFVLRAQGRIGEARDAYAKALALDPEFESAKRCLDDIDAALKAEPPTLGPASSAMSDELRRALREKRRALFDAAMAAFRLDRFATAYVYAEAAAKANRDTGPILTGPNHVLLAKLLTHLRRYEEAEKLLAPLLDDDNAPADDDNAPADDDNAPADDSRSVRLAALAHKNLLQALDAMGRLEERRGCFDAAACCYQRYIDAEPESHRGYLMLGHVLYRQGRLSEAESALAEAVKCQDANEVVHRQIGFVLRAQGRLGEARDAYAKALALDPEFESAKRCLDDIDAALEAESSL